MSTTLTTLPKTASLDEYAQIADEAMQAAAHYTRIRALAEREIGQLFQTTDYEQTTNTLKQRGWTKSRINTTQKLAQLTLTDLDQYFATSLANQIEPTTSNATKLLPPTKREKTSNLADVYTAPPIDVQLARELGIEVSDELSEIIMRALNTGLQTIQNPRHAYVWTKRHGINDDGSIGTEWTFPQIAATIGKTREYVEHCYYRASHHLMSHLAVEAITKLHQTLIATR